MIVLGVVSVVFGLFLLSGALDVGFDDPIGALVGMCGTVFVLAGLKALAA